MTQTAVAVNEINQIAIQTSKDAQNSRGISAKTIEAATAGITTVNEVKDAITKIKTTK